MSAKKIKHSGDDNVKFMREYNEKVFTSGKGEHLKREDLKHPNLRTTLSKMDHANNILNKNQRDEILHMAQTKQFKRVEQLATKYGVVEIEAKHLASVAKAESALHQHQKVQHVKKEHNM